MEQYKSKKWEVNWRKLYIESHNQWSDDGEQ